MAAAEDIADLAARVSELEVKHSFAEDQIEALNHTVYRQQQQIDLLLREMTALRRQLATQAPAEALGPRDELPPHY